MGKAHTFNESSFDIPSSERDVIVKFTLKVQPRGAAHESEYSYCCFIAGGAEDACLRGGRMGQNIV